MDLKFAQVLSKVLYILMMLPSLLLQGQEITNIRVFQNDKKVYIYYNLQGEGTFFVNLFYSTDDGETWKGPMQKVTGSIGTMQTSGQNKEIIWNALDEQNEHVGYYQFKINAELESEFVAESGLFTNNRDGEVYKWVRIGEQVWMAENLRATNYNDGTTITEVLKNSDMKKLGKLGIGLVCWYNNEVSNKETYGALYNWYAVNTGKICPEGWHMPSDNEWKQLAQYISTQKGPYSKIDSNWLNVGKHLKATSGWYNDRNGTNDFEFSGLPGGLRSNFGNFRNIDTESTWWSINELSRGKALGRQLRYNSDHFYRILLNTDYAYSIRCIMD